MRCDRFATYMNHIMETKYIDNSARDRAEKNWN